MCREAFQMTQHPLNRCSNDSRTVLSEKTTDKTGTCGVLFDRLWE